MPLPMVHFNVAKNLLDNNLLSNQAEFYLGVLSPDAIHMRENHTRTDKSVTHLNYKIYEVENFLEDHKNSPNIIFYLGYAVHILTDIFWRETVLEQYRSRLEEEDYPAKEISTAYYNDMNLMDLELYKSKKWRKDIWYQLENLPGISANFFVTAKETEGWKNKMLSWYDIIESKYQYPIKYINIDEIDLFVQDATKKIKDIIKVFN